MLGPWFRFVCCVCLTDQIGIQRLVFKSEEVGLLVGFVENILPYYSLRQESCKN